MNSKMSSDIDMSLEDIIKKKRVMRSAKPQSNKGKLQPPKKQLPVTDARLKIISKKRIQITDAREKLSELAKQKDARLKIEQMRLKRLDAQGKPRNMKLQSRNKFVRTIQNKERVFIDPSRQVVSQPHTNSRHFPRQINSNRFLASNMKYKQSKHSDGISRPKPIVRTVENDVQIIDDPMEEDFIHSRTLLNRKASLQLKIVAHNNDIWDNRSVSTQRTTVVAKEKSPPRPPSILKKRPMAALRSEKQVEKSDKPVLEYRIIVSNLRNTVTAGDIEELFGDVGGMVESRLVRPGTAEVIYKTQDDAQRAVDLYHNRQLDGQPMNCLLVTPRSNAVISRNNTKPALYSTNSNVEPDISTFHKVLFSNL
ncbi:unnamed protein product [Chilo suppressalis]|uniref:RRM domain-containing protein n=1 Tax=Chilo suppressalis TaxID=168631 RepID=A0ABN8BH89_CHISP|nr:unnamed protein product [Chilo suppressalis]